MTNVDKMNEHVTYGPNYSCGYFDNVVPETRFPKLQFVAVDEEGIIFVSSAYVPNLCAIKNKRIAAIFCSYFEQAWDKSIKIKEREMLHEDVVQTVRNTYK